MKKIKVFHFLNSGGGGVLSVVRNLLLYKQHPSIENHIIYTINKDITPTFKALGLNGATSEQIFYYSAKWNFYYTARQLAKLLHDEKVVVVAHDWLELGVMSNLGLQNPVVLFLHGDYYYYYELATMHQASIDKFITVAQNIKITLSKLLPERNNYISYLRVPVPNIAFQVKPMGNNIIFLGRLTIEKGYHLLAEINQLLLQKGIVLSWHIVGTGIDDKASNLIGWENASNIRFYGNVDNQAVMTLLKKMDFFILPSSAEGMPISLIEAMKAGLIPLVNDIEGGVQELIEDGVTGFKISKNNPTIYADCIARLMKQKELTIQIGENCTLLANQLFDPIINTTLIEAEIISLNESTISDKKTKRVYGSMLDQCWMPNSITKFFRISKSIK